MLLNGGQYVGLVRVDGTFVITDVRPGSHLLEVNLPDWVFEPVRVDVSARDKGKVRASLVSKPMERLSYPLVLRPVGTSLVFCVYASVACKCRAACFSLLVSSHVRAGSFAVKAQYFEQHQPWNWGAMLKNPMVIMLGKHSTLMPLRLRRLLSGALSWQF